MRKAVEKRFAAGKPRDFSAIVFLIEKKSRLLSVFKIDGVADAVFRDLSLCGLRMRAAAELRPALVFREPLERTDCRIVAFINTVDFLPKLSHNFP